MAKSTERRQQQQDMNAALRASDRIGPRIFCNDVGGGRIGLASFDVGTVGGRMRLNEMLNQDAEVVLAGQMSQVSITDWIVVPSTDLDLTNDDGTPLILWYLRMACGRLCVAAGLGPREALTLAVQHKGLSPWSPALRFDVIRDGSLTRWTDVTLRGCYQRPDGHSEGGSNGG